MHNMDMLTDRNNVIKVEDNHSFDQELITTEDIKYHNTLYHSPLPKYIDTDEVAKDDLDNQDINQEYTSSEHNIPYDLLYKPTTSEDYTMENIEAENDDVRMIQTKDTTDYKFDCGLTTKKVGNHMSTVSTKKPCSCHESNKPFNDKANVNEHLNAHIATKSYSCDKVFRHNSNFTEIMASVQPLPQDVAINGIKLECDESVKQGKTNQEHLTNNDMFGGSTITEDFVIDDIKSENDDTVTLGRISTEDKIDYDLESETITTEDLVTDNIKVKIKQEIITAEDFTNIDMLCRSSLPTDVGFNNVKVETCMGMKKDGENESATNADVKREDILLGKDYSSDDNIPLAEEKAKLSATAEQHMTKIPNDASQVKDKLSCDLYPHQTSCKPQFLSHLIPRTAVHKDRLQDEIKAHSSKKTYSCKVCHKTFTIERNFNHHIRIHSEKKLFSCDVCHKAFSQKSALEYHIRTHTGEKPFSCEVCHSKFIARGGLLRHMRTHSGEKPFSCKVCHKTFSNRSQLIIHMRTHSGEKPFLCDVCHKACTTKDRLIAHLRMHSGEKPFSCDVCHKAFPTKNKRKVHLRIHSGEKPFSCEVCLKTFSVKFGLTRHMRIHSGENLLSCEICQKKFIYKADLTRHMRSHSGEKPYSCQVCHKTFSQNSHVKSHIIRAHFGEYPYTSEAAQE